MKYFVNNKTGDVSGYDSVTQIKLIKALDVKLYTEIINLPSQHEAWDPASKAFVFDVVKAVTVQKSIINDACAAMLVSGFTSSALGAAHIYDSKMEDQLNLMGAASAAIAMPYTCIDAAGVKAEVTHTASQIKKVFDDGLAFKSTQLSKARTLKTQLDVLVANAATTQADIDLVVWV